MDKVDRERLAGLVQKSVALGELKRALMQDLLTGRVRVGGVVR